jgi:hypothetical protein
MYRGTNTMTVVVSGGSGTIAINGSQAQMDQQDGQCYRHRFNTAHITPSYSSSRNNLLQVLINAANNGCDQAVSNNAVAIFTGSSCNTHSLRM